MKRYGLLQIRNTDDPMKLHEQHAFARSLGCTREELVTFDMLEKVDRENLAACDALFIGGSGDYSIGTGGPWLASVRQIMIEIYQLGRPVFASCWGFHALADSLGGEVITELRQAELGTPVVTLTEAGRRDPLFNYLDRSYRAVTGHQDVITRLPDAAVLLAETELAPHAFKFKDRPIYATQHHPELGKRELIERVIAYPDYIRTITNLTLEQFEESIMETPEAQQLLPRFVKMVVDGPSHD